MARALFIGRFQPFHNGHLKVLKKLLKKYNEIIVVIGSAEQTMTFENPFTAGERIEMIRACFSSKELSRLIIVPVRDINNHNLWVSHLCSYLPKFDKIYSNNPLVEVLFKQRDISVKKFKLLDRSICQGKIIREKMLKNKNWQRGLPSAITRFIVKIQGLERLQRLFMVGRH